MNWIEEFYSKQGEWSGAYSGPPTAEHRQKASWVHRYAAGASLRVLELGCGGGQVVAALADLGHRVVGVDLCRTAIAHARILIEDRTDDRATIVEADFYDVALDGPFDVVTYFDGFGVGDDVDQRRLLRRISEWLAPNGRALIEVYTPWYWAPLDGRSMSWNDAERRYTFDAEACRVIDTWWPTGRPNEAVTQTLRCYSPADLRLLLEPTGLELAEVESGGAYNLDTQVFTPTVPLHEAYQYLAVLRPNAGERLRF